MWTAILSLLGAVGGLVLWLVKRKRSPSPEERADDLNRENEEFEKRIESFYDQGKLAEAEQLRRLRTANSKRMLNDKQPGDPVNPSNG